MGCSWHVSIADGEVRAVTRPRQLDASLRLPFVPSEVPVRQFVVCQGQTVSPDQLGSLDVGAILRVPGGYLVGYDSGEWGGGLYWYDEHGDLQRRLGNQNTSSILEVDGNVIVLSGLAHLGADQGEVLVVQQESGDWVVKRRLELPGAPDAHVLDADGSLLIVAGNSLVRIDDARRVVVLHEGDWWWVTSLVEWEDGIVMGMQNAVVQLTPDGNGYEETWFLRPWSD